MRRRSLPIALTVILILTNLLSGCQLMAQPVGAPTTSTAQATATQETAAAVTADPTETPDSVDPTDPASTPARSAATPTFVPPPEVTMEIPGASDVASYAISARLDPPSHQLTASETITYRNTGEEPIPDLVFHLYLNGFKSLDTIFMRESGAQFRGVTFDSENNGWVEVDSLKIADGPALELELLEDGTLARADLPEPVQPGETVQLEIEFRAQLPQVFARTGWGIDEQGDLFFLAGQWFPKLGVWTEEGWNAYPFHGNAEFFADFGDYAVALTVPDEYQTGATGIPGETQQNSDGTRTDFYNASGVIDFAWTASPNLESTSRMVGETEIVYLYLPEHDWSTDRVLDAAEMSVSRFSEWFGPYPYPRLTVVDVPEKGAGAGGMEYPTFITAGAFTGSEQRPPESGWVDGLEIVTVHEVAHQWWQSMVATNEAEEPWLDEGFAEYSTALLLIDEYGLDPAAIENGDFQPGLLQGRRRHYVGNPDVPMLGKAWEFNTWSDYVVASYAKPSVSLLTLERVLGREMMLEVISTYFERYQFDHPTSEDFREVAVEVSGQDLEWFFEGLVMTGETLNYSAEAIGDGSITVAREGELVIPTTIEVIFEDGTKETLEWDGLALEQTFTFGNQEIRSFEIDPEEKLLVDLDWTDNQMTR